MQPLILSLILWSTISSSIQNRNCN